MGPVALLIRAASQHDAWISESFVFHSPYTPAFDILDTPLHVLKRHVYVVAESTAFATLQHNRKYFKGFAELDREVTMSLLHKQPRHPLSAEEHGS